MDRRRFLLRTAAALGGTALGLTAFAGCTAKDEAQASAETDASAGPSTPAVAPLPAIGVQLYTVRTLLEQDFEGTIEQIAELGYDEVEFAGYYGRTPGEVTALLERVGLAAPSAHLMPSDARERPQEILNMAKAVGHDYLVIAYLTEDDRGSLDAYRNVAALLNDFGRQCADAGIQLAYHNHDFEFQTFDGTLPYDLLLQETDPELVQMELDLYWIAKAGHDPLAYFAAHEGRFPLCHVKDLGSDGAIVPVGEGTIDFPALFAQRDQAGLQHYFVEHDNPEDPMASIETSIQYLRGMGE